MTLRTARWLTVVGVTCAYALHVARGEFVYEDGAWLRMAADGQAGGLWPRGLAQRLWIWQGTQPQTFHAFSLFLHGVNAALVYLLARRLGLSLAFAGLAGVLFYAHRLGVETVAYAAQQGELLAAMGVLTACVLAAGRWWRAPAFVGILVCLGFGMLGKETAIIGIGLVILTAVLQGKKPPTEAVVYCGFTVWCFGLFLLSWLPNNAILWNIGQSAGVEVNALNWLLIQSTAAVRSLVLLVIPFGLTVDFDYDILPMGVRWFAFTLLVALSVNVWFLRKRWPMGAFCGAAMLLVLLPRLVVQTPRGYLNDHQVYLWLPFYGLLVASGLEMYAARRAESMSRRKVPITDQGALLPIVQGQVSTDGSTRERRSTRVGSIARVRRHVEEMARGLSQALPARVLWGQASDGTSNAAFSLPSCDTEAPDRGNAA